ncbi:transmembrane protein 253 [Eucyclogobius newberryi]|uniref:transmembrane protein 253 n=1 Tax=Eucyclogobius newberryi TaxID=166745 RepID=UPI003B5ACD9C
MSQNMFQEGLHQVYMQTPPPAPAPLTQGSQGTHGDLENARIHRWFGAVVNTRLLVSGVVQALSALACILTTVIYTCVSFRCAVSMATPVWSSLMYLASGVYAVEVQRKANKVKVIALVGVNIFSFVFGFSAMISTSLRSADASALSVKQRVASYVAQGSSITFTVLCLLATLYILFLCWRGLQRYSHTATLAYSRVEQEAEDTNGPLLENMEHNI